jgi:hypothetical protein
MKLLLKKNYLVFKIIRIILSSFGYWKIRFSYYKPDEFWTQRISLVQKAPENHKIMIDSNSGKIEFDYQYLHNNIKVHLGGYYGMSIDRLLFENNGIHEPQEEYVFQEVLKLIPDKGTMIELGSFWGFYSLWFNKKIKASRNYLIEPNIHSFYSGINNFKLNNQKGYFYNYFISDISSKSTSPSTVNIDDFVQENNIDFINILHSDIQGYELKMLHGAIKTIQNNLIDFIFISTHSNSLHKDCIDFLLTNEYKILVSVNIDESYSWDGIIVARNNKFYKNELFNVSRK